MPFDFQLTALPGVVEIQPKIFEDDRGWFAECFQKSAFEGAGLPGLLSQLNHSFSKQAGTLRGIHFQQAPKAQGKLIRCTRGSIFDVAVCLEQGPNYLDHVAIELNADKQNMLWVPPTFGHGFQTLEDNVEVVYLTTAEYDQNYDCGIRWDDPSINIKWPKTNVILSHKDLCAPLLGGHAGWP